jgi:hypothetical protein
MPSLKGVLEKFGVPRSGTALRELTIPDVQKDLITLEEQEGAVHFKFGVLYAREGQLTDDEMFSNEHGSRNFEEFLDLLGERVALKDFPNYRGGLDNRNNATGTHSVYTTFEGHEIMFHVSTLLPYHPENKQQVERKRHLGNDIVVIIFMEGNTHREALQAALTFDPSVSIKSQFNHIFAVVTHNKSDGTYRLCMYSDSTMPDYSPPLPVDGLFQDPNTFRDFLLAKLINGEKAAYSLPVFSEKRERTLDLLIKGVEQRYKPSIQRRTSSNTAPFPSGKKAYEAAFTEFGQKLKVERYLKGTHPTSQRSTQTTKNSPWEPHLIVEDFSHQITCGDFYDENMMVVATPSDGTFLLYRDGRISLLIDKSVPVVQLVVAHKHDLVIFRTGFSKDNHVYIVPLPYFHGRHGDKILDKSKLSSFRVAASKGAHLFCTTPLEEKYLRLFVAVKNKVFMWMWKHTSENTPKNLGEAKIGESLTKHREVTLSDTPQLMTMKEQIPSGKLFVSHKSGIVEVVDEISAEVKKFAALDPKHQINNLSLTSDARLLIGYNFSCRLCGTEEEEAQSKTVDFNFYSEPQALVHINAYILAFNSDSLEIRLASNGSLVQSMSSQHIHILSHKRDILFVTQQRLQMVSSSRSQSVDMKFFASNLSSGGTPLPSSGTTATALTSQLHYIYRISYDRLTNPKGGLDLIPRTISVSSNQTDEADGVSVDSSDSTLLEIPRGSRSPSYSPDPPRRLPSSSDQNHTSPGRMRACMKKTVFFSTSSEVDSVDQEEEDDFFPSQIPVHSRGLLRSLFQHDSSPDSGFVPEEYKNITASNLEVLPLNSKSTMPHRTSSLQVLPLDTKSN